MHFKEKITEVIKQLVKEMYMKKIYITSLHLSHGGVEKMICNLANLFIKMGFEVEILCTYYLCAPVYDVDDKVTIRYLTDEKPNHKEINSALKNFQIVQLAKELFSATKTIYMKKKTMKDAISNINSSIIISTRNEHSVLINQCSNNSNHLIAQLHHDHLFNKKLLNDVKYRYKNFNYLLLLTDELTKEIESEIRGYNDKIKCLTVPNFLKLTHPAYEVTKDNQFISVGRLHTDKGYDRLLILWKEIIKLYPIYKLKIVGDGPLLKELKQLSTTLGISNTVEFSGAMSNSTILSEISKSKIFFMTSVTEGFGLVLVEALSQGIPTIAYDVRVGPRAIIKNGYNGYLIEENNIEDYVEKVKLLLENKEIYNEMSKNAIISSLQYSENSLRKTWEKILETKKQTI